MNEGKEILESSAPGAFGGLETGHFGVLLTVFNVTQANTSKTLFPGVLSLTPILADIYIIVPISRRFNLTMGGGGGYVMASHTLDSSITEAHAFYQDKIIERIRGNYAGNAVGSLEYRVSRSFSIQAQVIHLFYQPTIQTEVKVMNYTSNKDYLRNYVKEDNLDLDMDVIFMTAKWRW